MVLKTPDKIRNLQRKLYLKAKSEPDFRFYLLYDKIYREDILIYAYRLAKANSGSAGTDGVTFDQIESEGATKWLAGIREQLREKTYRPQPVRRVMIPKPGGGERPLGIPTIRDRVVQTATKLVIAPIFEADLEPNVHGYRPKRSALDAIRKVYQLLKQGYTDVVDADLSKYFDTIPHQALMQCVSRRIVDRNVLLLIKLWLKTPVVHDGDKGSGGRVTGGRKSTCGTPQGGVISPLLANLYMNRFLKYWRMQGCDEVFRARVGYEVDRVKYRIATNRYDLSSEQIAQAYKLRWNIENFFALWKRHLKVYHLIARSSYGLMVQILSGLITYLLLAIYCHNHFKEKVSIRRVRQLRTQIENELRCWPVDADHQRYEKEPKLQNVSAIT
ncbi:hypothetical protein DSCW_00650 [Desulfosarcina widdelii]|uniref:Reverse transcriptase domain-containing protein n=1 Tax=Desulfosarcina widdelii TaxID=947919 RepID=A0A5K7YVG8_9BACT|nr:hypothetical protein DSCW_00650 [Desulfosarcina widdelii]